MKKGFTLIELLAVIIVIALISAIVVPFVTDTVNNAKNKIYKNDIKSYGEAIKKAALAYELEHKKLPESIEDLKDVLKYDGSEITCDKIIIENRDNVYMEGCSVKGNKLNDFVYGERPVCMLVEGEPKEIGSKYQCKVKDDMEDGFEDGYYFYVLSSNEDGSTNLIMDRNICEDGTLTDATKSDKCWVYWISKIDYNDDDNYGEFGNTNKGPITVINHLESATKDWTNLIKMEIDKFNDDNNIWQPMQIYNVYARLPYYSELEEYDWENGTNTYLYEYLEAEYGGISSGDTAISGISGYWTFSAYSHNSDSAWYVSFDGSINLDLVEDGWNGVRPVITVQL